MKAEQGNSNYEPVKEGQHIAYCFGVIGLGRQKVQYKDQVKVQPKARLMFVLPDEKDEKGEPRIIGKTYTLSLDDRATLFKDLKGWRAKGMSDAERKIYDLDDRLGKPATITVIHKEGDKGTYSVIEAISPVPDFVIKNGGLPDNPMSLVSYDITQGKNTTFNKLPKRIQDAILASEELNGAAPAPAQSQPAAAPTSPAPTADNVPY